MRKVILLCFVSTSIYAQTTLLENLRPFVEKNISKSLAAKIWGDKDMVTLPEIPIVKKDAKDMSVYNKKEYKSSFTKEQMSQYNLSYINELIKVTRELDANRDELSKWYGTLEQGGTREGVYQSLVLDPYYQRLENYNQSTSKAAIDYTITFFKKYLGKDLKEEKLSSLNIFSVKRITVNQGLDVADVLLSKSREEFCRWYAVLSSELAGNTVVWQSKLRKTKESGVHYRWAMKMTPDIVKSEYILKMHMLYNHLQKQQN